MPERNHGCPVFVDLISVISDDDDHSFSSPSVPSLTRLNKELTDMETSWHGA
jgi:hypothetical protein